MRHQDEEASGSSYVAQEIRIVRRTIRSTPVADAEDIDSILLCPGNLRDVSLDGPWAFA